MVRLGIEPRHTGYIPGALPLSYLALGDQLKLLSMPDCTSNIRERGTIWIQSVYLRITAITLENKVLSHFAQVFNIQCHNDERFLMQLVPKSHHTCSLK